MRHIYIFMCIVCCLASLRAKTISIKQPNIIVILTDDHGFADLGVQNVLTDLQTPNIDELAKNGIRMESGYISAPQCVPSRAGIMTGKYQQRFGTDDNKANPVPLNEILLPQRLKQAGYVTGMTGKWHLDPNYTQKEWIGENIEALRNKNLKPSDVNHDIKLPYLPSNRGFDEYFCGTMNRYWANYSLDGKRISPQYIDEKRFRIEVQTTAALSFIERNHAQPFFLYLAYFGPHVPLEATEKYVKRFPGNMPERRRHCLAMLSAIDDGVGDIRQLLNKHGLLENTIIFFLSDNGAPLGMDKNDLLPVNNPKGSWDGSLNDPYIGEKGMLSEGGIRVPYLISWPAVLPKNSVYNKAVSSLDIASTSVAVAGLKTNAELDGVNLIPFLTGENKAAPHTVLYWRFWDQAAIRMGNLKFLKAGDREYLFDVNTDLHEHKNIIDQFPEKAAQMKDSLKKWAETLHSPGITEHKAGREYTWYDFYFEGE